MLSVAAAPGHAAAHVRATKAAIVKAPLQAEAVHGLDLVDQLEHVFAR